MLNTHLMQTTSLIYAPTRKRFLAALIDYGIYFTLCFMYISVFGEPELQEDGSVKHTVHGFLALLPIIAWFLFFPILEGAMGQTFGKKIVGLKVILISPKYSFGIVESLKRRFTDLIEISF